MKSSYVAATAQLSLSRLTVKSACLPGSLSSLAPLAFHPLRGLANTIQCQHHPTSTRDRFTWLRRLVLFQASTLYIYVLRILYEARSPVAVASRCSQTLSTNKDIIIRYRSSYFIFSLSCARARARIYFISIHIWPNDSVYKIQFTSDASTLRYLPLPMLRKVLLKKCLKVITHLLAINEPLELRGRVGLAAGAI